MAILSLHDYESFFKTKVSFKVISFFLRKFGTYVTVERKKIYSQYQATNAEPIDNLANATVLVYGDYSGLSPAKPMPMRDIDPTENVKFTAQVLFTKILNSPIDAAMSGNLERQTIYTYDDITTTDILTLDSDDGTKKLFIVGQPIRVGMTTDIIRKFEIDNLGGNS